MDRVPGTHPLSSSNLEIGCMLSGEVLFIHPNVQLITGKYFCSSTNRMSRKTAFRLDKDVFDGRTD